MSESEAKRLGLAVQAAGGTTGTSTGGRVGFRVAVARELTVGGSRFQDVSFLVFPDSQAPWASLAPGRRGLIGVPILLGLGSMQWAKDGTVELGGASTPLNLAKSNLYFDDDHLVAVASFQGQRLPFTLDTGAETTDIYKKFATKFPALLSKTGQREQHKIEGVGNTKEFQSIEVPQLAFGVGGLDVTLKPAHVLLSQVGPAWAYGNLGLDALRQGNGFAINFQAMTITMSDR